MKNLRRLLHTSATLLHALKLFAHAGLLHLALLSFLGILKVSFVAEFHQVCWWCAKYHKQIKNY